jgi:IS30 family transposase
MVPWVHVVVATPLMWRCSAVVFSKGVGVHGDAVVALVDAGVSVRSAAASTGLSTRRVYEILQATGRGSGRRRTVVTDGLRAVVVAAFGVCGTVSGAAGAAGLSAAAARLVLVRAGLVPQVPASRRLPAARARFAELLAAGWSEADACGLVGVDRRTARDWRRGVRRVGATRIYPDGTVVDSVHRTRYATSMTGTITSPLDTVSGRYLTLTQRLTIADAVIAGRTVTDIAALIGKNKSCVSRELRAHRVDGHYGPHQAHQAAAAARARPKTSKLVSNAALAHQVQDDLRDKFSPEQISHRLVKDFPDDESMRVSHETIYQALYLQARGGLKRQVQEALRTGRTRRKPHRQPGRRTTRFVDPMVMISERPAEADDRAVPGHWEGDLILGEFCRSAIGTLVERTTRYTMLIHLPGGHTAEQVRDGLIRTLSTLPAHLRGSLTWDQGSEMARHRQIQLATNLAIYFCDPASPWQRGSNENTNGLLRQYFPKSTDLSIHSPEDLEHVAQQLNRRPRKTLAWDTPAERLRDLLKTQ